MDINRELPGPTGGNLPDGWEKIFDEETLGKIIVALQALVDEIIVNVKKILNSLTDTFGAISEVRAIYAAIRPQWEHRAIYSKKMRTRKKYRRRMEGFDLRFNFDR